MRFDFAPLWRSSIGPPYDVLRTGEDRYRINLAVAGFSPAEITITAQQNKLTISGRQLPATELTHLERDSLQRRTAETRGEIERLKGNDSGYVYAREEDPLAGVAERHHLGGTRRSAPRREPDVVNSITRRLLNAAPPAA